MKAEEIKVGHIYYVNCEPHLLGEFDKNHLAVVIKKNSNKITYIAIPLTSNEKGVGVNKISLGHLDCLPTNLQQKESYAVIDQGRTLNAQRFSKLYENHEEFDAVMPRENMIKIYKAVIRDLLHDVPYDELLKIFF